MTYYDLPDDILGVRAGFLLISELEAVVVWNDFNWHNVSTNIYMSYGYLTRYHT